MTVVSELELQKMLDYAEGLTPEVPPAERLAAALRELLYRRRSEAWDELRARVLLGKATPEDLQVLRNHRNPTSRQVGGE